MVSGIKEVTDAVRQAPGPRPGAGRRVLLSFVGNHGPFRGGEPTTGDGPRLTLLTHEPFVAVHLFYNC
jgi:hypothetical protein